MENFYLQDIINSTECEFLSGDPHAPVHNVSIDTRTISKGDVFVALRGKNFDGNDFVKQAIDKKAGGLVISLKPMDLDSSIQAFPSFPAIIRVKDTLRALGDAAAAYRKKWKVPVIAVTGSNGKTTTKEMLHSVLSLSGETLAGKGNLNNQIGVPLTLFQLGPQYSYAVVEMGTSWPGEIERLSGITAPDIGIITNIGASHLENFKDPEGVFREKIKLVEMLPGNGVAVLNADDPYLGNYASGKETVTFGMSEKAMVRAENVRLWPDLPSFEIVAGRDRGRIRLPVYGKFNIYNALAAAAAASRLGIGLETIVRGIEGFAAPKWRMEKHRLISGALLINDAYNANPSSMRESIESIVQTFQDREKILVLGDMLELGESSADEHRKLGEFISAQPLSRIFLYGPKMKLAYDALKNNGAYAVHFDKKDALTNDLRKHLNSDSLVLLKGSRGMGMEEIVRNIILKEEVL